MAETGNRDPFGSVIADLQRQRRDLEALLAETDRSRTSTSEVVAKIGELTRRVDELTQRNARRS